MMYLNEWYCDRIIGNLFTIILQSLLFHKNYLFWRKVKRYYNTKVLEKTHYLSYWLWSTWVFCTRSILFFKWSYYRSNELIKTVEHAMSLINVDNSFLLKCYRDRFSNYFSKSPLSCKLTIIIRWNSYYQYHSLRIL